MMDGMMGMGWWWMALWGLIAVAVLALAVLGATWLARNLSGAQDGSRIDSAEQHVRQLYAAGDIDRDEYLRRIEELRRR